MLLSTLEMHSAELVFEVFPLRDDLYHIPFRDIYLYRLLLIISHPEIQVIKSLGRCPSVPEYWNGLAVRKSREPVTLA